MINATRAKHSKLVHKSSLSRGGGGIVLTLSQHWTTAILKNTTISFLLSQKKFPWGRAGGLSDVEQVLFKALAACSVSASSLSLSLSDCLTRCRSTDLPPSGHRPLPLTVCQRERERKREGGGLRETDEKAGYTPTQSP